VGSAFAGRMAATAINIRGMLNRGACRAAIIAVGICFTSTGWMSAFLIGSHLSILPRIQSMFLSAYSALASKAGGINFVGRVSVLNIAQARDTVLFPKDILT
jgi:hypothetical protein